MGQEILYCFKCQTRLLGSDFERGKAFRVDSQAACPDCVRSLLAHLPDPDAELERMKRTQVPKPAGVSSSSTKLPPVSTSRIPAQPPRTMDAAAAPSRTPLLIGAVVGGVVLLLILAMAFSGSNERRSTIATSPTPAPTPNPEPRPAPVNPVARDLEELDARLSLPLRQEKFQEAAAMLAAARGKHSSIDWTRGLDERQQRVDLAARRVAAPILERVGPAAKRKDQAALKELRSRIEALGVPALIAEFDSEVAAAAASDPWTVLDFLSVKSQAGTVLSKLSDGSVLASGPNPRTDTFVLSARVGVRGVRTFRLEGLANPSLPAGGPGRAGNGNFVLSEFKVESGGTLLAFLGASATFEQDKYPASASLDGRPLSGWAVNSKPSTAFFHLQAPADLDTITISLEHESNHHGYMIGCFRISVGTAELPPPPAPRVAEDYVPKPQPTKEPPPVVSAYRARWAAVAKQAAARDLAGAVKSIEEIRAGLADEALRKEADADIADFKLAADALAEIPRLLPRWAKGSKVELQFLDETGVPARLEGTVLDASPRGVTIQAEGGPFDVPAGELSSGTIATLLALRPEKKTTDARAVAVLAALEGSGGDPQARFPEVRGALDPKEAEARRQFWTAEEAFASMRTRGAASPVYEKLLSDATLFAARNKAFLEERAVAARDAFFFADDFVSGGTFSLASSPRLETYWVSSADSAAGKAAANYVEIEIVVPSGGTSRAWVYAGGCCQEVFTFYLQGTGLSGPSAKNPRETVTAPPGGEEWIAVRPPSLSLKKKHADHTGPKEPDRWTWIELGALKFADAGPKKLRLLTEQKGFSIAYLAIGAGRQAVPRESEVKDLLRNRPAPTYGPTGTILREIWRGINGDTIPELTNTPKFKEGKPDESGMITHIDSWNMGNQYGCRIRGYVHPPLTGDYVFWVASDDHSELWLSTDETPDKKQKIAHLNHPVGHRDFGSDPSQKSAPIPLVAGRRYYIECLQKQGGGGEHVAAGWTLPGGVQERPIPPSRLSHPGAIPTRKVVRPTLGRGFSPDAPVAKSACPGGQGGAAFEMVPNPRQLLRGAHLRVSSGFLGAVKPVFQGPGGDVEGSSAGEGSAKTEVIGRPGYVVGGLVVRATDRVNAVKLIFVKVSGNRLVSGDRYETEWFGSRPGGTEVMLGDGVTPVLGIYGRAGAWVDGIGLVLQGK